MNKENRYFCVYTQNGQKASHRTNHTKMEWKKNQSWFASRDILLFCVDFLNRSIEIHKNGQLIGKLFENIPDINNTDWRLIINSGYQYKGDCIQLLSCKATTHAQIEAQSLKPKLFELQQENIFSFAHSDTSDTQKMNNLDFLRSIMIKYGLCEVSDNKNNDKIKQFHEISWKLAMLSYNPANIASDQIGQHLLNVLQSPYMAMNHNDNNNNGLNEKMDNIKQDEVSIIKSLQEKIDNIDVFTIKADEISSLKFDEMNNFVTNYEKSLEMTDPDDSGASCNDLETSTQYMVDTLKTKSKYKEIVDSLEHELKQTESDKEMLNKRLKKREEEMKTEMNLIKQLIKEYVENNEKQKEELEKLAKVEKDYLILQQQVNEKKKVLEECDQLVNSCNKFNVKNEKCVKDITLRRGKGLNEFESKWLDWEYRDIIFWFKIKLGYFNTKISLQHVEHCTGDSKEQENIDDVRSIDYKKYIKI